MHPRFAEISLLSEFRHCLFLRINVDILKTIAKAARVKKVPTFKVYVLGKPVATMEGTNTRDLLALLKQHCDVSIRAM